jgi:MazG family protein
MSDTLVQLQNIITIMAQLRDPKTGCPWDIQQNFASIAPYTIEEAYEVADAIETGDRKALQDELGDLLLQVIFHARIAEEEGSFSLADVAKSICGKMIDRHPHVFGNEKTPSASGQKQQWENIKEQERTANGKLGVLDNIPFGLPPMQRAIKLQKRAARVGFDWPEISQLIIKMQEEASELLHELQSNPNNMDRITDEVGDLLFVAVNLARKAGVDPETALISCNKKFEKRFNYVEKQLNNANKSFDDTTLGEMECFWQAAKIEERND